MIWTKEICNKLGNYFYDKLKDLPSIEYEKFILENEIKEFSGEDLHVCINQKTEDNIIIVRRMWKTATYGTWQKDTYSTTYSTAPLVEDKIYILVPKEIAQKIIILEKLQEK
jgi:hypothetical protein